MRKLVQTQVVDQERTAGTGMNNPRATQKEIWCCLARRRDVLPPRPLSNKELPTLHT